ncbi:hypothetical protein G6018_05215 [Dietzia sp. DQ11-44]|nr:hypothetical protein [Dietzia sp. Cai40]MBB1043921.1 hypothetical protein [Dietzia sp. DQ11-44]MBB1048942.1 hypothetical protein [Dietzia cercidiphylli]MBB1050237.1 hypothetical protein [Dietzia sp. CW19]MBB1053219.1 hypothetical protein [Dietzia sp. B44]MBB1058164.1 hypothetical protein [Dietzia sp. B19]MBC7295046.1 hypothetical protein [Dietzia sp.]
MGETPCQGRKGVGVTSAIEGYEEIRWSQVEDSFFVGSFRGNFVGYIDQNSDGSFTCYDRMSRPQGESGSLDEAISSLNDLYFSDASEGELNVAGR